MQEMGSVERMPTQDRLKHARKRRSQQLKKWAQYERQLEKESTKKRKHQNQQLQKKQRRGNKGNVRFAPNIALLEAAARNDLAEVRRLLETGVSPDVTNEDGLTALHQCCIDDSNEMMKLLLEYNANVNACDSEMWTPLHAAATCGHVILCGHLIDRGAELLAVNADGNMPYDICEDEMTLDYIETEMAKRGITQEQIDLTRLATEHQMLADLKEYTAAGGDLEYTDQHGATPLHVAAANGYIEVAEFLLDNHVSVDTRDNESWQPVHAAAYWAQQEILELLVENGADLDAKTRLGETPFDLCEDPDLKQKILDMKDEIETKRSIQRRQGSSRRHRVSSRNASIRRSSMRGDKSQLFKKEHKEEALHFGLNLMQDEEMLMEAEEEHENVPATDLDEVTIVVTGEDDRQHPILSPPSSSAAVDVPPSSNAVTTVSVNKPTPKPRSAVTVSSDHGTPAPPTSSQSQPEPQRPSLNTRKVESDSLISQPPRNQPPPSQKAPVPRESNHAPPPPQIQGGGNVPSNQGRRQSPGSTLSDLKKHRSNSRENLVDIAMQSMFLESLQGGRRSNSSSGLQANSVPSGGERTDKTKNGHNNNNTSTGYSFSTSDGQLRRFVAPTHSRVVGEEEDKERCCVIL